ncbi:uncharacterized protein METZ01_LOCUS393719 [marine metagenome]|uniref:Uncharacterized protein n=1 Tax=marine metagenome TaxID=408172 RepID=A0A382V499_9ZZZZ
MVDEKGYLSALKFRIFLNKRSGSADLVFLNAASAFFSYFESSLAVLVASSA